MQIFCSPVRWLAHARIDRLLCLELVLLLKAWLSAKLKRRKSRKKIKSDVWTATRKIEPFASPRQKRACCPSSLLSVVPPQLHEWMLHDGMKELLRPAAMMLLLLPSLLLLP
jgi:hypothetical protein